MALTYEQAQKALDAALRKGNRDRVPVEHRHRRRRPRTDRVRPPRRCAARQHRNLLRQGLHRVLDEDGDQGHRPTDPARGSRFRPRKHPSAPPDQLRWRPPIEVDGEVIGAVGVAGGSADQDDEIAAARPQRPTAGRSVV